MKEFLILLYTALLRLYPQQFRKKFAGEMQAVFVESITSTQGNGESIYVCARELRDFPTSLIRSWSGILTHRRDVTVDGPSVVVRNRRLLILIFIPIACVTLYYVNGYLKTSLKIAWYAEKHGVHATLDEAIDDYIARRDDRFPDPRDVVAFNGVDRYFDFIRVVCINDKTALQDGDLYNCLWPHVYFVHTRNGWIHFPMNEFSDKADLGYWMKVYHLNGVGP
jgi:hypothetical protein